MGLFYPSKQIMLFQESVPLLTSRMTLPFHLPSCRISKPGSRIIFSEIFPDTLVYFEFPHPCTLISPELIIIHTTLGSKRYTYIYMNVPLDINVFKININAVFSLGHMLNLLLIG